MLDRELGGIARRLWRYCNRSRLSSRRRNRNRFRLRIAEPLEGRRLMAALEIPLAAHDSFQVVEDTVLVANVLENDQAVRGGGLAVAVMASPTFGDLSFDAEGNFSYVPEANFFGSDSFEYRAFDGEEHSNPVTVLIDVTPVNDAPIATRQGFAVAQDAAAQLYVGSNDSDPEYSPLTTILVAPPDHGTLATEADGSFLYTPQPGYSGEDRFVYKLSDGVLESVAVPMELDVVPMTAEEGTSSPSLAATWGPFPNEALETERRDSLNVDSATANEPQTSSGMLNPAPMLADLAGAIAAGDSQFTIPAGTYDFTGSTSQLKLKGVKDFVINAQNVDFIFAPRVREWAIHFIDCENVTLRGLTIDYSPLPYAQGKITKINPDHSFEILLNEDSPLLDDSWVASYGTNTKTIVFGPDGKMRPQIIDWLASATPVGERLFLCTTRGSRLFTTPGTKIEVGDSMVLPDRQFRHTIELRNCERCSLEGITLWSAPNMGFVARDSVDSRFIDCKILRKPGTERLLSSNADGIFSMRSQGTIIERAQIEYTGDDMVNIHGGLQYLMSNGIVLAWTPEDLQPGQTVSLYDQQGSFQGAEVIRQIREVTDLATIDQARAEAAAFGLFDRIALRMTAFEVEFTGDVAGPRLISNDALLPRGISVRDSRFSHGFGRGVSFTASGTIESNTFEGMSLASIAVGAYSFWGVGPIPQSIQIARNTIVDSNRLISISPETEPISISAIVSSKQSVGQALNVTLFENSITVSLPASPEPTVTGIAYGPIQVVSEPPHVATPEVVNEIIRRPTNVVIPTWREENEGALLESVIVETTMLRFHRIDDMLDELVRSAQLRRQTTRSWR